MNNSKEIRQKIYSDSYDLAGNSIYRIGALYLFSRIFPVGNLGGGPGLRCLVILTLLHTIGHPLYKINARYGKEIAKLRAIIKQ